MSDILADGNTLADWNGSADNMHWTPDSNQEPEPFPVDLEELWQQIIDVRLWRGRPVPKQPKRLDARYHQRQKNRRKHRR